MRPSFETHHQVGDGRLDDAPQDDAEKVLNSSSPGLEAKGLLGVEHGNDAQGAAFALRPTPGKGQERAALAGNLIDVAADILDAGNAVGHHDLVRRLPVRKILDDV